MAVDATEIKTERPKDKEERKISYSGKRKQHDMKVQLVINLFTLKIYKLNFAEGSIHDLKLLKGSEINIPKNALILGDLGYQGINKLYENSLIPYKKPKNQELDDFKKLANWIISSLRVSVEHVIGKVKQPFKMLSTCFRNQKESFKTWFNFAAIIYNLGLNDK